MFLDTNFLIDLEEETGARRVGAARRFLHAHRGELVVVSVIALGELAAGMDDNDAARTFLAGFRIVTLKPEIALEAAAVDRELIPTGNAWGKTTPGWLVLPATTARPWSATMRRLTVWSICGGCLIRWPKDRNMGDWESHLPNTPVIQHSSSYPTLHHSNIPLVSSGAPADRQDARRVALDFPRFANG